MTTRRMTRSTVAFGCRDLLAAILCTAVLSSVNASSYALKRKRTSETERPAQVVAVPEPQPSISIWIQKIAPKKTTTTTTTTTTTAPTTILSWPAGTKRRRTYRWRSNRWYRGGETTSQMTTKSEIIVKIEDGTDACPTALTTPAQVPRTEAKTVLHDVDTRFVDWFVFTYTLQSVATVLIASFTVAFALYCFVRDRCWRPLARRSPAAMANMLLL